MSVTKYFKAGMLAGVGTVSVASCPQALAQETAADIQAEQKDSGQIADIIVTAQRRSERMQDVPIAVSAVSGDALAARGVNRTVELVAAVPSVTMFATAGYLQPRIRGVGNNIVSAGYEGGVAVYVDGVYQFSPQGNLFALPNVERVEVLKGPQGTLFGRNATGGLIQIITRRPSEDPGGTISLGLASYRTLTADAYVTGGLGAGLSASMTGHVEVQDKGWGINEANGKSAFRTYHDIAVKLAVLGELSDRTEVFLTADYADNKNNLYSSTKLAPGTGFGAPGFVRASKKRNIRSDIQPLVTLEAGGAMGRLTHDFDFATLTSITAYRQSRYHLLFDGDATNVPLVAVDITQPDKQFSQEVQLTSSNSSRFKWVVGIFYFDGESKFDPNILRFYGFGRPVPPPPAPGPIEQAITYATLGTKSLAGYAQATAPLGDTTNLTLGFRYTRDKKSLTDVTTLTKFAPLPVPVPPPGPGIADKSVTYNRPTWRVALDHHFSPDVMGYISYNRGFKAGGYNGQFPTDAPFNPEKIDAYEAGLKADLFDRTLRLNGAAFLYNYKNIQVSRFIGSQTSFYNGAAARTYGFDLDFEARVTPQFTLSGGFTVLHDRFTDFPNAVISTQVPTGIIITTGSAKGNRLPLNADFSGTISASYRIPLDTSDLTLDASWTYNDGYYTQPDNILRQPSYNLVSAGATLAFGNGLSARIWGRNLLNEDIFTTLLAGSNASNASYQAPRTYGITISATF